MDLSCRRRDDQTRKSHTLRHNCGHRGDRASIRRDDNRPRLLHSDARLKRMKDKPKTCKRCGSDEPKDIMIGWFLCAGYVLKKSEAYFEPKLDTYFCSRNCLESYQNNLIKHGI